MKINITCPTCAAPVWQAIRESGQSTGVLKGVEIPPYTVFDLTDDRYYEKECCNGHVIRLVLEQQRFETLFDIGACAIVDGYTREVFLSFVGSVERFYEFWIRCVMRNYDVDPEQFQTLWNHMAKQSERQVGAFASLYCREFSRMPALLGRRMTELRNDVAHKGKIPSTEEAIVFGDHVIGLLRPSIRELRENYFSAMQRTITDQNALYVPDKIALSDYVTMRINTVLSTEVYEDSTSELPLREQLSEIKRRWSEWGRNAA